MPGQSFIYQNGIKVVTFRGSSKRSKISSESEFKQPVNFKIIFFEIANARDGLRWNDMLTRALKLERVSKSAQLGSWIEPKSPGIYINLAASAFEDTQDAHIPNTSGADPTWPQSRLLFQKKISCHRGAHMDNISLFFGYTHINFGMLLAIVGCFNCSYKILT